MSQISTRSLNSRRNHSCTKPVAHHQHIVHLLHGAIALLFFLSEEKCSALEKNDAAMFHSLMCQNVILTGLVPTFSPIHVMFTENSSLRTSLPNVLFISCVYSIAPFYLWDHQNMTASFAFVRRRRARAHRPFFVVRFLLSSKNTHFIFSMNSQPHRPLVLQMQIHAM
jgi:hypothetical protein